MIPTIQNAKKILPLYNTSTTAAATATGVFDTLGYDYLTVDLIMPTADVVSNKPTVLKLTESDTTDSTNYGSITGTVAGTDFTNSNAITSATSVTVPYCTFNVDLRARKRYIKISVSPATTQVLTAIGTLVRAEQTPATSSAALNVVNV